MIEEINPNITTDDVVRMAIEDLFPDQEIPDENNYLPNGQQHKAPDHSILEGTVVIERKSRNAKDQNQYYRKISQIAASQGMPIHAYGRIGIHAIIRALPDPEAATKQLMDFSMSQTLKTIKKARDKFKDYQEHAKIVPQIRMLIISDNTEIVESTATHEFFIGRKMGAIKLQDDRAETIDVIAYVKNPNFTHQAENSYWFKCLVRERLNSEQRTIVNSIISALHHRIGHYAPFYRAAHSPSMSSMKLVFV